MRLQRSFSLLLYVSGHGPSPLPPPSFKGRCFLLSSLLVRKSLLDAASCLYFLSDHSTQLKGCYAPSASFLVSFCRKFVTFQQYINLVRCVISDKRFELSYIYSKPTTVWQCMTSDGIWRACTIILRPKLTVHAGGVRCDTKEGRGDKT